MIKIMIQKKAYQALSTCIAKKDAGRAALEGVHITDKYIEATDGRMLLRLGRDLVGVQEDAKPGAYSIIGARKDAAGYMEIALDFMDGAEYPNTENVIPAPPNGDGLQVKIQPEKDDPMSTSAAIIRLYNHTGNAYSAHLLSRLASLGETWTANKAKKDNPIRMDAAEGNYTVVLMPFQMKE